MIAEKITLFVAIWIIVALFITGDANIELFLILIFIGLLIAKEITHRFNTPELNKRMNVFIAVFFIFFIIIVGKKIIDVLAVT